MLLAFFSVNFFDAWMPFAQASPRTCRMLLGSRYHPPEPKLEALSDAALRQLRDHDLTKYELKTIRTLSEESKLRLFQMIASRLPLNTPNKLLRKKLFTRLSWAATNSGTYDQKNRILVQIAKTLFPRETKKAVGPDGFVDPLKLNRKTMMDLIEKFVVEFESPSDGIREMRLDLLFTKKERLTLFQRLLSKRPNVYGILAWADLGFSTEEKFDLIKLAVERGADLSLIDRYGLSAQQIFDLAILHYKVKKTYDVLDNGFARDYTPHNFTSGENSLISRLTHAQQFQIAYEAAKIHSDSLALNIRKFDLTTEERIRLAHVYFDGLSYFPPHKLVWFSLPRDETKALMARVSRQAPREVLQNYFDAHLHPDIAGLREHLHSRLPGFPADLPTDILSILWDRVQKREVGLRLLEEAVKLEANGHLGNPKTSLEILSKAVGLNEEELASAQHSEKALATLYELSLDLEEGLTAPAFQSVNIESSLLRDPKLSEIIPFFTALRSLKHLYGNNDRSWKRIVEELRIDKGITKANVENLRKEANGRVVDEIKKLFKSENLELTFEQFERLQSTWGDLDPMIVLITRFQGNSKWRNEISVLANVFKAALEGNFVKLKFEGLISEDQTIAKQQLAPLKSEEARKSWMKPEAEVWLPKVDKLDETTERLKAIRSVVHDNLYEHIGYKDVISNADSQIIETIVTAKANPVETLAALSGAGHSNESVLHAVLHQLKHSSDLDEIKRLAQFVRFMSRANADLAPVAMKEQVESDLEDIVRNTKIQTTTAERSLLLTVRNFDAKYLLQVGDLVDAASCQNYRTGTHIETLLGYVIDANVEAVVTYALTPNHFSNVKDFEALTGAIAAGQQVTSSFNGDKRIAEFKLANGQMIESKFLGKASARQILKLGSSEQGEARLFLERAYVQPHPFLGQMLERQEQLVSSLAIKLGGKTGGVIRFNGSRNPGGVYSDAATGAMTGAYAVGLPKP